MPSSSLVEIEVEVKDGVVDKVEVGVGVEVDVGVRHGKRSNLSADTFCQQSIFPQKIYL